MSLRRNLSCLTVITLTGCSTCDTWQLVAQEAPLCAAHQTATAITRTCHPPPFVVASEWTEEAWNVGDSVIQKDDVVAEIDAHLLALGFIDRQTAVDAFSDGIQQRVAGHRFFIVSIRPTIVLMTLHAHGDLHRQSLREMASPLSDRVLPSKHLVNGYHYGHSVPVAMTYQWFSPAVEGGIRAVTARNNQLTIEVGSVTLTFGERGTSNWYIVTRE